MRAVKLLLAASCATSVIGMAGAAHADDRDDAFLQALHDDGIEYASSDKVIASAKAVCSYMAGGHGIDNTVQMIVTENPNLSSEQAAVFMDLARDTYCPTPPMGGGGGG
jgi:hypothetical protein